MKCENCGGENEDGALFCRDCGAKMEKIKKMFCRDCGAVLTEGARFCTKCGAKVVLDIDDLHTNDLEEENSKEESTSGTAAKENASCNITYIESPEKANRIDDTPVNNKELEKEQGTVQEKEQKTESKKIPKNTSKKTPKSTLEKTPEDSIKKDIGKEPESSTTKSLGDKPDASERFRRQGFSFEATNSSKAKAENGTNSNLSRLGSNLREFCKTVVFRWIIIVLIVVLVLVGILNGKNSSRKNTSTVNQTTSTTKNIPMIDVVGMNYPKAIRDLHSAGFTNITDNVDSGTDEELWFVLEQSVKEGKTIKSNKQIELTCGMKCKLYIDIRSKDNLLFGTYDIVVTLDGTEIGSISNGEGFTYLVDMLTGDHILNFYKAGDTSVNCRRTINVTGDMTYSCTLSHSRSSIDIENENTADNIKGASLIVPEVTGMVLSDAMMKLSETGFSNVREEPYGKIWDKTNWIVTSQGIPAASVADKNKYIQLDCKSLDDFFSESYVGKNPGQVQDLAESAGFNVIFENESKEDMTDALSKMDDEEVSDWIVIKAKQYGGEEKTAIATLINTKDTDTQKTESASTVTPTPTATPTPPPTPTPEAEEIPMPVMKGTNRDVLIEAAKAYGLSRNYADEDFGHGTMNCTLATDDIGFMLEFIYSWDTNEVLCGRIIALTNLHSDDEKKNFIIEMAPLLCPAENAEEVKNWVAANIGGVTKTDIDGFVYEVDLGLNDNFVFYAGNENWEKWERSLN